MVLTEVKNTRVCLFPSSVYVRTGSLPVVPVRFEMLLCELHHTVKPLPEGEVPPWQAFLSTRRQRKKKVFTEKDVSSSVALLDCVFTLSSNGILVLLYSALLLLVGK